MSGFLASARLRLRSLLFPGRVEDRIDEELRFHLDMEERNLRNRGVHPADAGREARRRFGDRNRIKSDCKDIYMLPARTRSRKGMGDMLHQDLRFALRNLAKRPGFTVVAVITLALGIAVNTTIFSLVEGAVLRALPYEDSERLVVASTNDRERGLERASVAYPEFLEWAEQRDIFESIAVVNGGSRDLTGDGEPERVIGYAVSEEYFAVMRAQPILGRTLTPDDYGGGADSVVVLSNGLWQRRYGSDPGIVGREIRLSDRPYTVVGVVDEEAVWPLRGQVWSPLFFGDPLPDWAMRWDNFFLQSIGRLQPGVELEQAQAVVSGIAQRLAEEMPALRAQYGIDVFTLQDWVVPTEALLIIYVLLGAVSFVLLLACVNVANLLLVRATEREQEMAVRRALGADRGDLLRQLFTESIVLSLAGTGVGILLASWGINILVTALPSGLPRSLDLGLNLTVLSFAIALAFGTALFFSLVPAFHFTRSHLTSSLKEAGRSASAGRSSQRLRSSLIVVEVTLSLVLLLAAGMMMRTVSAMLNSEPGIRIDHTLTLRVSLPNARYPDRELVDQFYMGVTEEIAALPGVRSAAGAMSLPLAGGGLFRAHLPEGAPEPPAGPEWGAQWNVVTPGFFRTGGIPIIAGRDFTAQDTAKSEPVIIVAENFAQKMFPGEDPLGKRFRSWRDENVYRTIVGVVGNVRQSGLDANYRDLVYVSRLQTTMSPAALLVHTDVDPSTLIDAVRAVIWNRDPDLVITNIATMEEVAANSIAVALVVSSMMGLFGAMALVLAAVGLYGLMSYSVAQRNHEFGVRMALGAATADVLGAVFRKALLLAGIGMVIGIAGGFAVGRVLEGALPMSGFDPLTFVGVPLLLVAVMILASVVPARRATRVDPVTALKQE